MNRYGRALLAGCGVLSLIAVQGEPTRHHPFGEASPESEISFSLLIRPSDKEVYGGNIHSVRITRSGEWKGGIRSLTVPWDREQRYSSGDGGVAYLFRGEGPFGWGGGVEFSAEVSPSGAHGSLFPTAMVNWRERTGKNELLFTIPLNGNRFPDVIASFALSEEYYSTGGGVIRTGEGELSIFLKESIRLNSGISLSLIAEGPPALLGVQIAVDLRSCSWSTGVIRHPHWGILSIAGVRRNLSL